MRVWIDQDLCTGCSLCSVIAPRVFTLPVQSVAYVKDGERVLDDPGGEHGVAPVPTEFEDKTNEAAEECPAECIFVEV